MPKPPKNKNSLFWLFAICFASGMFGATISTLMSSYLPQVVKEFSGNRQATDLDDKSAVISAVFLYGWMFGGIIWGIICDRIGRKKALIFSTACYGAFAVLTALAPVWSWVVICRFFSGFGVGGVIVTSTIYLSEVWPSSKRAVAIGFLTICFPVGVFLSGAVTYLFPEWRSSFYIGIIPLALSLLAWLVLKEPVKENNVDSSVKKNSSLHLMFDKTNRNHLINGAIVFGTMLIGLWAIFNWLPTWIQDIIVDSDGQKERGMAMMWLAGAALLGGCFSGWITQMAGLKKSMMACFLVCFAMSFALFKQTHNFSNMVYVKIGVLGFFFGISQGVLSDYLSKIFPAEIRATATGFCFNAGRLFTATTVFFVGYLVHRLGGYGNSIFAFSSVFIIGFIATFFVEENAND